MRIVYSISSIACSGGTERVLCTKANYLANVLKYDVHIVVRGRQEKPFFVFSDNITIHYLELEDIQHRPWMFFGSRSKREYQKRLFEKLDELHPDITISVFGLDAEFLYKSKDGSKKILEFHFTKNYLRYLGAALLNDRCRLLRNVWMSFLQIRQVYFSSKYKHIVLLTERDKQLWGGGDCFAVIPNPLSFTSEVISPLTHKIIIAVGRLTPQKGFDLLIPAFREIVDQYPDWKLIIYGEGQDGVYLNNLIKGLSLQNHVFIEQPVSDVEKIMLNSSLFVFPSRYEGFGLVLTEAMECGVPCVAFDCECGPSDIIRDGEDGFLAPAGDIKAFADKMSILIGNEDVRREMGKKAKQNVQRFQPEQIMKLWDEYLSLLLNKKGG